MNKKKKGKINKKSLIILLTILIAIILCFSIKAVFFKSDEGNKQSTGNNNEINKDIDIKILDIDDVSIDLNSTSSKLSISGKMDLSYNSKSFVMTNLRGHCVGKNDEIYYVNSGSEWIKYPDKEVRFTLYNSTNFSDVIYPDGSTVSAEDVDWKKVEIKSCKIERFSGIALDFEMVGVDLSFEKEFD